MKKLVKVLAVAAFGLTAAGASHAATSQATFQVSATVSAACSVAATDLAFGAYSAAALVPLDNSSTVTVTCTNGTTYGVDVGATPMVRTMTGPGGNLSYGMYNELGRTTAFGVSGALAFASSFTTGRSGLGITGGGISRSSISFARRRGSGSATLRSGSRTGSHGMTIAISRQIASTVRRIRLKRSSSSADTDHARIGVCR